MAQLLPPVKSRFLDDNGDPLAGGLIYTYAAGTTTPLATYTNKGGGTANTNPVVLDARGEADIWLADSNYKITVHDSTDTLVYTVDNVKFINDGEISAGMLAGDSVNTVNIVDGAVTFEKLADGALGYTNFSVLEDDYTVTLADELLMVDAISNSVTLSLPSAASAINKIYSVKRTDDLRVINFQFVDGDVTIGSDTINETGHSLYNAQEVQLTTSGTLPSPLAILTKYYVIYVDANNFKLALNKADAKVGTAIDITSASGGGTHVVASTARSLTVDPYLAELIDGDSNLLLTTTNEVVSFFSNGVEWFTLGSSQPKARYVESNSSGTYTVTSGTSAVTNMDIDINSTGRNIVIGFKGNQNILPSYLSISGTVATLSASIIIYRDGTALQRFQVLLVNQGTPTSHQMRIPPGSFSFIDTPGKGDFNYTAEVTADTGTTINIFETTLVAYEI